MCEKTHIFCLSGLFLFLVHRERLQMPLKALFTSVANDEPSLVSQLQESQLLSTGSPHLFL